MGACPSNNPGANVKNGFVMNFKRQKVLVTGGTRGIGRAIAEMFCAHGAKVTVTGTQNTIPAGLSRQISYFPVDFSDHDAMADFLDFIARQKRIDVCVNNAGINQLADVDSVSAATFDMISAVNYRAPYLITCAVSRVMKRNHYGRIINIASIWSVISKAQRSAYSASKSGLIGMTRTFAIELAPHHILVNAVSPGFVNTELTKSTLTAQEIKMLADQIPVGRLAKPREIAHLVLFLGSERNSYLSGQNLVVDGGFSII